MWSQVGSCPQCGAPIYVPTVYHSIMPPPNHFTCNCVSRPVTVTTTNTNPYNNLIPNPNYYNVHVVPCPKVQMRYGKNVVSW